MNRDQFLNSHVQRMDWLMTTARRNPEAFLVMAAGAALLMRARGFSRNRAPDYRQMRNWQGAGMSQARAPGPADYMRENARGYASTVSDTTSRAAGAASEYASAASDAVRSYASTAADYASQAGEGVRQHASRLADQATSFASQAQSAVQSGAAAVVRDQPLAVALLGVAAGAAVAALFPSTKIEERTLGPARDRLAEAAREMGENVVQSAKEAGVHLKQSAVERGLSPDGMKEMAREAADTFKSRLSGSLEQRSGTAPPSSSSPPTSVGTNRQSEIIDSALNRLETTGSSTTAAASSGADVMPVNQSDPGVQSSSSLNASAGQSATKLPQEPARPRGAPGTKSGPTPKPPSEK